LAGKFAGIYFIAGLSRQQQKALEPGKFKQTSTAYSDSILGHDP
jgi:hypothetical protein